MIFSALIAVVVNTPLPSPAATSLPVIIQTESSAGCSALHSYGMPLGFVIRRNDDAFRAMARSMQTYLSGIHPGDVPPPQMVKALPGMPKGAQANATGAEKLDDQLIYSPGQTLTAADIDSVANQIYSNLVLANKVMATWQAQGSDRDPQLTAMREHLQNLIDLQRGLADRYERFAWTYLSNKGMAGLQDPRHRAAFKAFLRELLLGEAFALTDPGQPQSDGFASVSERARLGTVAGVEESLRDEELALAPLLVSQINSCNGTHYGIQAPHPGDTP